MTQGPEIGYGARVIPRFPQWFGWARDRDQAHRLAVLSRTPVFAGLPRRLLGRLAVRLFEKRYASGEVIFHEGDPGKGLFVVLEGEVEIEANGNALVIRPRPRPREGWSEAFAEMAARGDDKLLDLGRSPDTRWDAEEWEWR